MIEPQPDAVYLVELCSGEQRRWRCLAVRPDEAVHWWRDIDSGREFSDSGLMYAWQILARADTDPPEPRR